MPLAECLKVQNKTEEILTFSRYYKVNIKVVTYLLSKMSLAHGAMLRRSFDIIRGYKQINSILILFIKKQTCNLTLLD